MTDNIYANIILELHRSRLFSHSDPLQDEGANHQGMEQAQDHGQQL